MSSRILFFSVLTLLGTSTLLAQRPVYRRPVQEEKRSTVGFSTRILLGVKMDLNNLGDVGFPEGATAEDSRYYQFSDGSIAVAVGKDENGEDVFADRIVNFDFYYTEADTEPSSYDRNQEVIKDFTLSRYRSESTGATAEASEGSNYGWEVTYGYQWGEEGDRLRLGFMGGFAVSNLDFSLNEVVQASLRVQDVNFILNRAIRVSLGEGLTGHYQSAGESSPIWIDSDQLSGLDNPDREFEIDGEEYLADVRVAFDYDGILAMLRVGPTASLRLIDELHLELSAGLVGVYLNSRISLSQTIINIPVSPGQVIDNSDSFKENRSDLLYGFFAEGLLRYQLTPRVGFFSSMMYMNVSTPENTMIGPVSYDLSLESPMFATTGLRLTF